MKREFILHPIGHPAHDTVKATISALLASLSNNRPMQVTFDELAFSREAQGYWHGTVVKTIRDAMFPGEAPAEVHEYLMGSHYGWKPSAVTGHSKPIRTTTTDEHGNANKLRKSEMGDLIEWAIAWAAERGVYVPEPVKGWKP